MRDFFIQKIVLDKFKNKELSRKKVLFKKIKNYSLINAYNKIYQLNNLNKNISNYNLNYPFTYYDIFFVPTDNNFSNNFYIAFLNSIDSFCSLTKPYFERISLLSSSEIINLFAIINVLSINIT